MPSIQSWCPCLVLHRFRRKARGLSGSGRKAVLVARLDAAIAEENSAQPTAPEANGTGQAKPGANEQAKAAAKAKALAKAKARAAAIATAKEAARAKAKARAAAVTANTK